MPRATWKGTLLAESSDCEWVEGNYYFPRGWVVLEHCRESETRTVCPWKGTAHYYHVEVDGEVVEDAAWYYPDPKPAAANLQNHVAFSRLVDVE